MAGHRFRFQPLLDLRITERDIAQAALAQAHEAVRQLNEQRQALQQQRQQLMHDPSIARTGRLRIDSLLAQGRYERQLAQDEAQLMAQQRQMEAELLCLQTAWLACETEVRRLERIQANDRHAFQTAQRRAEQAGLDEIAARTTTGTPWD